MAQGLPGKVRVAFIRQALFASVMLLLGLLAAGVLARHYLISDRLRDEAIHFWLGRAADPAFPLPKTSTMRGYYESAGGRKVNLPEAIRRLEPGVHDWKVTDPGQPRRAVYVERRREGTFFLTFDSTLIDRAIVLTAAASLLLGLLTIYWVSWLTLRITSRMFEPINRLSWEVGRWDPINADDPVLPPQPLNLPIAGIEVQRLTLSFHGLRRRLREFVQRERDFTRDASHELRTPLTVIRVATDVLLGDPETTPQTRRSLARIQRAGRAMEAVIDAFLILARESEVALPHETFEVRAIVDEEVDRIRPLLVGKSIELRVVDEGAPQLLATPHVLKVMLGNLLSNAAQFTDRGQIVLRLTPDRIEVRDSGIGMSPETLARAFDPFYRADIARPEGNGMGLSIVRRLGARFGWVVTLTSTPDQGTTAVIHFAS